MQVYEPAKLRPALGLCTNGKPAQVAGRLGRLGSHRAPLRLLGETRRDRVNTFRPLAGVDYALSGFAERTVLCQGPTGVGARRRRRVTTRRFL